MQRAAVGGEIGVAKGGGIEERPTFRGCGGVKHLERPAALFHSLAIFVDLVAGLERDADEASGVEMVLAEIAPHLGPCVIGLGDQRAVAGRGTIGAADDAVMVTGGSKRIRDACALLQQRHAVAGLDQRPGGRQAGNAGANDDDVHCPPRPLKQTASAEHTVWPKLGKAS